MISTIENLKNTESTIEILYNDRYGASFYLTADATDLFNQIMKNLDINFKPCTYDDIKIKRHEPILVQLYHEMANNFSCGNTIKSQFISKKYENYYSISNDYGLESVIINYDKYKTDLIKSILKNTMTNDEKIAELNSIFFDLNFLSNVI